MIIETYQGSQTQFRIERARDGAFQVSRLDARGYADPDEAVAFTHCDVALAYGRASAALDRYLVALDTTSDAREEFEAWMTLDEAFEMLAMALKDSPRAATAMPTLH
ncbi:MAG: hypothetical protein ACRCYS_14165 [Beijerinckiaceae bacterium]